MKISTFLMVPTSPKMVFIISSRQGFLYRQVEKRVNLKLSIDLFTRIRWIFRCHESLNYNTWVVAKIIGGVDPKYGSNSSDRSQNPTHCRDRSVESATMDADEFRFRAMYAGIIHIVRSDSCCLGI